MVDFKVFRGKAEQIIIDGAPNPRLVIEEGCWYLCTNTAELFLGVLSEKDGLTLKQINKTMVDPVVGIIDAYINEAGELLVVFSDGSEKSLGKVIEDITIPDEYVTEAELALVTQDLTIEISEKANAVHTHELRDITDYEAPDLTSYATKDDLTEVEQKIPSLEGLATENFVEQQIKDNVPTKVSDLENDKGYLTEHQDLSEYAKKSDIPTDYLTEIPDEYVTEDELNEKGYLLEQDLSEYAKQTDLEEYTSKDTLAAILSDYVSSDDLQTELSTNYYDKETADKEFAKREDLSEYYKKTEADDKFIDRGELATELIKYATVASLSEVSFEVQTLTDNLHDKVHNAEFAAYAEATSQAMSALNTAIGTHTGQISAINGQLNSVDQSLTPLVQQVYGLERTKADRSELSEISSEIAKKADLEAITEINAALTEKLDVSDFNSALQDYYTKSETYNQTEVNDLLKQLKAQVEGISKLNIKVLDHVPEDLATEITEENTIYLVPTATGLENSSYDEYLLIKGVPERIGSTNVSLAGYVKEEDLINYVSKTYLEEQKYLKEIPSNYITETELGVELASYYTAAQADETFVSPTELSTKLVSYLLADEARSIYVPLTTYNAKVAELTGFIQALQNSKIERSELANYYTSTEVAKALEDTKAELNGSITKVANDLTRLSETHNSDIAAIQQTTTELTNTKADKTAVEDVRATVNDINTLINGDDSTPGIIETLDGKQPAGDYATRAELEAEVTRAQEAEELNAQQLLTLVGNVEGDTAKSVREIAKEEAQAAQIHWGYF